ncbi:MAG: CoA transferase [Deltaproteobacteria bacterium]|nr:CoA transferase [Deltaproteobacteria bacterium]
MSDPRPLDGIRVVDMTQYEAGPSATQILAWLGAEVIKIEPPSGEPSRHLIGGDATRDSIVFVLFNQSKRSVVLDLTQDADRERLRALLRGADVLAENFAPTTLARLGLPIEALLAELPRLIVASVRGYGPNGPWSGYKSLDFVGQATGGAMSVNGAADGTPMRVGVTIADSGTGLHLTVGILAALLRRERTGRGGRVEVSLQDAVVNLMRNAMAPTYVAGTAAARTGNAYVTAVPSDLYPCKPGGPNDYLYILLAAKQHWEGLLRAIDRTDLLDDPRFARQSARNANPDAARAVVRAWTERHDKLDAMQHLSNYGVPCGAVLDTAELLANEQLRAAGMIIDHHHPQWGDLRVPACPIRLDGFTPRIEPAPALGADTEAVLRELK